MAKKSKDGEKDESENVKDEIVILNPELYAKMLADLEEFRNTKKSENPIVPEIKQPRFSELKNPWVPDPNYKLNLLADVKDLMSQKDKLAEELTSLGIDFNPNFIPEDEDGPTEKWDTMRIDLLIAYLKIAIGKQKQMLLVNANDEKLRSILLTER